MKLLLVFNIILSSIYPFIHKDQTESYLINFSNYYSNEYINNCFKNYTWVNNYEVLDEKDSEIKSIILNINKDDFKEEYLEEIQIIKDYVLDKKIALYDDFDQDNNLITTSLNNYWQEMINLDNGWKVNKDASNVSIAILDSGIDASNYDLKGQINETNSVSYVPFKSALSDNYGHGTKVAGIIAGLHNNKGVDGICEKANLISIRIADDKCYSTYSAIAKGFKEAINKNYDIINFSYGFSDEIMPYIQSFIDSYKGLICLPSENKYNETLENYPLYPQLYDSDNIVVVGGCDENDKNYYCYSKTSVDIIAPSRNIKLLTNSGTTYESGCSYATPMVAATAALYLANNSVTTKTLKNRILNNVDKLDQYKDKCNSSGRLNVAKVLCNNHSDANYNWKNYTTHSIHCNICEYESSLSHIVAPDAFSGGNKYATCLLCGGNATSGLTQVNLSNELSETRKINDIIILGDEDYYNYISGVLNLYEIYEKFN